MLMANQERLSFAINACHRERSEGPWFLPLVLPLPANTTIPRLARNDSAF